MLNKVILMGRLTRDPELRTTPNGVNVASFSIAVNRDYTKAGEERIADFINCVAWRNTADFVSKYFIKGMMIIVEGRIQSRSWTDTDGRKRYATDVVCESVQFGETKKQLEEGQSPEPTQAAPTEAEQGFDLPEGFALASNDEDLPF